MRVFMATAAIAALAVGSIVVPAAQAHSIVPRGSLAMYDKPLPKWFRWGNTSDKHKQHPCIIAWGGKGIDKAEICSDGYAKTLSPQITTVSSRRVSAGPAYWCDGNGVVGAACTSLQPNTSAGPGARLFMYTPSQGAWRWTDFVTGEKVTATSPFKYKPIDKALEGRTVFYNELSACIGTCDLCMNLAPENNVQICDGNFGDQPMVLDPTTHWLVGVGASNAANNWMIVCNPGGTGQVEMTTRNHCSTYHSQWAFVTPSKHQ